MSYFKPYETTSVLTTEENNQLLEWAHKVLDPLDYYRVTDHGLSTVFAEWWKNKGWIINDILKTSPNYVEGKYLVALPAQIIRVGDMELCHSFLSWAVRRIESEALIDILRKFNADCTNLCTEEMEQIINDAFPVENGKKYAHRGQKMSRILRRLLTEIEHLDVAAGTEPVIDGFGCMRLDKDGNPMQRSIFERKFAEFADALNPKTFNYTIVISANPIDYFTMSYGHEWNSCMDIDKHGRLHEDINNYDGCYSGGTLSYMLDSASILFYTVDPDYKGTDYFFEEKLRRNMFHIGEDKYVQGRIYPDDQVSESGRELYKQIREFVAPLIANAYGAPNLWKSVSDTEACGNRSISRGEHYKDYLYYHNCNVNYLIPHMNAEDSEINWEPVHIGHVGICPGCGRNHSRADYITCYSCTRDDECEEVECAECGYVAHRDDMVYIENEDEWYCTDCCSYCEYYEEYTRDECISVPYFGRVSESALENSGRFYWNEIEGSWVDCEGGHTIYTEDDTYFSNASEAKAADYVQTDDGYWYPIEECEEIDNVWVHTKE